jgi:hypothetical protein
VNIDWSAPFSIVSPAGTFLLNQVVGGREFKLNPKRCVGRRGIRAAKDNIPQADGDIFHERYAEGSELQLAIQLWANNEAACDDDLVDMYDELRGILWSLLRPVDDGGRVIWTPAGKDARMIDAARLLVLNDPDEDAETGATELVTVIDTPFPYAISLAQTTVVLNGTGNVQNDGNVEFWPVIRVNAGGGGCGAFTIEHEDGLLIEFDSSYSGVPISAGGYGEIDTHKGTMFLNGDEDDLSAGLVALTSDFFPILPGANSISAIGAAGFNNATFLVNDAFA